MRAFLQMITPGRDPHKFSGVVVANVRGKGVTNVKTIGNHLMQGHRHHVPSCERGSRCAVCQRDSSCMASFTSWRLRRGEW